MRQTVFRIGLILLVGLGCSCLPMAAAVTEASSAAPETKADPLSVIISINEKAADVRELLSTIFLATGANYVISYDITGKVQLGQREATARDILDHVCATQGLHWWKRGDSYIVSTQPAPSEGTEASAPATSGALLVKPAQAKKTRYYNVKNVQPRDLSALFNSNVSFSPIGKNWGLSMTANYSEYMNRKNNPSSADTTSTALRPFSAGESRIGESPQFPGGGFYGGGIAQPGLGGATPLQAGIGQIPGQPLAGTRPGYAAGQQQYQVPAQAVTEEQLQMLQSGINLYAPFASLLPPDMTAPIAYEPLNLLIFEATDEAYDRFLELIRIFDQRPKQVIIETQFITMSTNDAYALGLDWFFNVGRTAIDVAGLAPAGFVNIRVARGQKFAATLSTLLLTDKARLVQSARVATMNHYPASIVSTSQEPYVDFSGGGAVVNGGIVNPSATVRIVNVPTSLTIIPQINGDDSVTALLTPTITSFRLVEIPTPIGKQNFPATSSSSLSTLLNVKDGETMVMGGFVIRNEELNRSKIPLLSDLPILGPLLFTSTSRNSSDTETLIFVTPHVIKEETAEVTPGPL